MKVYPIRQCSSLLDSCHDDAYPLLVWSLRIRENALKAKEIRDSAQAENRCLTPWEEAQARTLERAALCSVLYRALEETFKRWEVEFGEANKLTKPQLKMLNLLARRGVPFAQKMLQDRKNNLPPAQGV